jgi:Asp-tRNA(Asn)/Glu-tRNA(Gln) amidotransferase A subunit family amidase
MGAQTAAPPDARRRDTKVHDRRVEHDRDDAGTPLAERSGLSLARSIRTGELSARQVIDAHIALLEEVNPKVNAVIAPRFDAARAEADAADARIAGAEDPDSLPPLLGVPCTIKESIAVEGMPNSAGVVARGEYRAPRSSPAAGRLIEAGAIVLGMTNLSELCMWIESNNRLYGRTHNPYRTRRIAGGSSGGEGAAIGMGGSAFGIGSDVGGSIRIPAFCCGVFGHKPSLGLVPLTDTYPEATGETTRLVVNGPLARRAEDLMPVLRAIAGPDDGDPVSRSLELGDPGAVDLDGLDVIISERAFLRPVSRELLLARERAAGALAAAGARLRHESLRDLRLSVEPYLAALSDGYGASAAQALVDAGADAPTVRAALRRTGPHTLATYLLLLSERTARLTSQRRIRKLLAAGRAFARELAATVGDGVLLHPPLPDVAPRHGGTVGRPWWIHNMSVFNLAALPVTQVPLGMGHARLPLGVQVVTGDGRDHVSIAVALELERVFGGWVPPWRARRRR